MDKSKIAILTTVANFDLYQKTSQLFPKDIQKYIIDGTNGMHGIDSLVYMMDKLKNRAIDWLIMVDEDVIFYDSDTVFHIIKEMHLKSKTVCGVRDGGVISHRNNNPYVINTFFSILNLKAILEIWNKKEVMKNQYILDNEFSDDLSQLEYHYDKMSMYEPYYCFYFWLRRNQKQILFLESKMDRDQITNSVLFQNKAFLCHTWYARSYGSNEKHTSRINLHLNQFGGINQIPETQPEKIFKHKSFHYLKSFRKTYKLILMKLNG